MNSNNDKNVNVFKGASSFREEIKSDLDAHMDKFKDPLVMGELLYKLLEERENTNRILKNILAKLESIEGKSGTISSSKSQEVLLPQVDESILEFIKSSGKVTAEDIKIKFNYKGTNAACARLSRLFELNLLDKKQVGKKVFYFPK